MTILSQLKKSGQDVVYTVISAVTALLIREPLVLTTAKLESSNMEILNAILSQLDLSGFSLVQFSSGLEIW